MGLQLWILALLTGQIPGEGLHDPNRRLPNVLLVIMDDIANEYIDCYDEGPEVYQPPTPNIDWLASRGTKFTNCYANPVCSPTRAMLLTGRHSFRTGIGSFIFLGDNRSSARNLKLSEITLPELLRDLGYFSAMIGKWHLGREHWPFAPNLHGFDVIAGSQGNIQDYSSWNRSVAVPWTAVENTETTYSTSKVVDDSLAVIAASPGPWFVVASTHAVHNPFHFAPADLHDFPLEGDKFVKYQSMIQAMDTEFGRLLAAVDLNDTVVILVGDNGSPARVSFPIDQGKKSMYEGGINVPMIMAGRGIPEGVTTDALVNTTDVYATILDLVNLVSKAEDSRSLIPVLQNPDQPFRDYVYSEWFDDQKDDVDRRAVRGERYKLIRDYLTGEDKFFDLQVAEPGTDGEPLDVDTLSRAERDAYKFLDEAIALPEREGD